MIGQTVSHYKILEKLGEGGMGVVYRAHDTKLERDVALKFLPPYLASEPGQKERFFQEARAASALNHPNITTIHEIDEHYEQIFIAMELVEGKTLKELIKAEPLPIKKVLDMAIQVCDGLTAAAEKGVVHRDIKSDNIIVTPKMQVKIMDFGLAKLKGTTKLTQTGSTVGTAAYMSPEQAAGDEVDHRSDIFSFGVVLYEMLTGKLPFRGEHPSGYIYSILNEDPPPLARFNDKVSPELQRIVSKALSKDKDERYQHIDEFGADLRRERKNLEYAKSTTLPKAEAVHKPQKPLLKILLPTSAVIVIALLFFIFNPFKVEVSRDQTSAASQNALAVMYFENIPDPEDKDHTGEMLTNLLITALSQTSGLEVISRQRLYDIQEEIGKADAKTITPSLASKIARRAGVRTMVLGTVLQSQPNLAITAQMIDVATGKILSSQRLSGYPTGQMFAMVDSLAQLVRSGLDVGTASASEAKSVAEVTTSSPEAYRSFIEGRQLMYKYYGAEARAAVKRALELDSNFAMAYYLLAYLGENQNARMQALEKAWKLRKKVAEKERLAIEAFYASAKQQDPAKAASLYGELLKKYPHEQPYYADLANTYMLMNDYGQALETYRTGLKYDSLDKVLLNGLAYVYAGLNERQPAFQTIERYLMLAPGEPNPYDSKGEIYFVFGDVDSALIWYGKALALRADFLSAAKLGFNAIVRNDYEAARNYFHQFGSTSDENQKLGAEIAPLLIPLHQGQLRRTRQSILDELGRLPDTRAFEVQAQLYAMLAFIAYKLQDYPALLEWAQKNVAVRRHIPGDYSYGRSLEALAWEKNGNPEKARRIAAEIKKDIPSKRLPDERSYDAFLARLALEEGKSVEAAKLFDQALVSYFPNRAPCFSYGVALLKAGRTEEAIRELERVCWWSPISSASYELGFPFSSAWPVAAVEAHYWLGVAYEQKGDKAKARAEYEKFLDIWKEADFQSPEMADAKARLAKLQPTAAR